MKKLFLLLLFTIFIYAQNTQDASKYTILKQTNQILYETTLKITNNGKWRTKFFSLSTYTYYDFGKIFNTFKIVLKEEQKRLNQFIPIEIKSSNQEYIKALQQYNQKVFYYLSKSPDKLENVYYFLYYYSKMIRVHNFLLEIYKENNFIYKQIYLTPLNQKNNKSLYHYFHYLENAYIKAFNTFVDNVKNNTYWFLRYFGKSVKFEKEIP